MASSRRPVSALLIVLAVLCLRPSSFGFINGVKAPTSQRGSHLVARVSAEYLERLGPKDSDVPFSAAAATGPTYDVVFKKRPFGILRYQPGEGGKGAMAMEIIP
eukprot:CAMPEP_0171098202 /NCGR_PEP_ID=MMETSP0766_2-20121228/47992_1 /TAXON_ID=439317 /ORGANISM="Gambierdiscus australes, Strain CAWD 149" /LENGTH=103 /DNA_ID=CAMNT_0011557515 /DNA_START=51 /DNA_END=359 /DNA_ORIENTATION=+